MKFKDLPIEDKPRERLISYGAEVLSNEELLMIVLKSGTKKHSVKELAGQILTLCRGITNLKNITYQSLMEIDGIGKVKAIELVAIVELAKRIYTDKQLKDVIYCTSPSNIVHYFKINNYVEYGINNNDYKIEEYNLDYKISFSLNIKGNIYNIKSSLIGKYNMYNLVCAITLLNEMNIDINDIIKVCEVVKAPPGRTDIINYKNNLIIVYLPGFRTF